MVFRELINREKNKNTWTKIKRALDKSDYSILTKLIIPMAEGEEEHKLTKKEEIHKAIINYNIKHDSKPEASPFGLETFLCNAIGPHGTTEFADIILTGDLTSEEEKDIQFEKAFKLLNCMKYQELPTSKGTPAALITDSIQVLINMDRKENRATQEDTTKNTAERISTEDRRLISLEISSGNYEEGFRK